jgi:hypothetical protein
MLTMTWVRPSSGGMESTVRNDHSLSIETRKWLTKISDIYTCATVIHTARLCLSLQDSVDIKTLQESFNDCLECLCKYEVYGKPAKRCRTALQMLERRAFPTRSGKSAQR